MIAVSLSAKVAASLSAPAALELSSLFAIRSGVAAAARELELLRAFLRFAEARRGVDALAATWIDQVRDAAFELEDVADEYSYLSGRGFVRGCADLGAWFALSRRLRRARERLRELSLAKEEYGIFPLPAVASAEGSSTVGCSATSISRKVADTAYFLGEEEIVGFAAHRSLLMEWLTEDAEPRRTLVAVWGSCSKLLLRLCRVGVHLKSYTTEDLLKRVLKELQRDIHTGARKSVEEMNYRSLVEALQGILSKKRYLVLLDDVWGADAWFAIRSAFVDNGTRSRIIITTRSQDVANLAKSTRIILLKPLPEKEAWCLFCNTTFREDADRECPWHLEDWALKILNKCSGLPLAIVSVGNLLALKEKSEFAWKNVHDSLVWDESTSHGIGQVSSILNLSIDDLPYHLKRCFLYCSIYPEDFFIKRKILIRRDAADFRFLYPGKPVVLPNGMENLACLQTLKYIEADEKTLHSSELKEDSIGLLSLLPRLFDLSLVDAYEEKSLTFAAGYFPVLRKLRLEDLAYLAHLDFQKGSLLALEKFILSQCFELIEIPQGIENLMHLKNLELSDMSIELTEEVQQRQESEGKHQDARHTTTIKVIHTRDGWLSEKKFNANLCILQG
ncbi:hypothetical protein HU200_042519 [Digitaria exilis]|uniref:Uncharacterized protein n=1 Tax=Digitaria exilis TaxID=1010633 RepID=A0A835EEP3_9POAL|nr:hypothetical protein HU200_042519 [Digitaria exilis]